MRHCIFVAIVDMFDLRDQMSMKYITRATDLYEHGVSPTELVYQSKLVFLQVVLPSARTTVRDQLNIQTRGIHALQTEYMVDKQQETK